MKTRTWPYGSTREVEVISVETCGRHQVVACGDVGTGRDREGFVLIVKAGTYSCVEGDRGTITFIKGGPFGGTWSYQGGATS